MRNRYPGRCGCGSAVAAREGSALRTGAGKAWAVWCRSCRPARTVSVASRRTGRGRRRTVAAGVPACVLVPWDPPHVDHDAVVEVAAGHVRKCSSAYAALAAARRAAAAGGKRAVALRLEADMVEMCVLGHVGGPAEAGTAAGR